jgi:hypothetical protein
MRVLAIGILAAGLTLGGPAALEGQWSAGPEIALADDVDFGIGGVVSVPLTSIYPDLEFAGRFTLFFPDGFDYWEVDGDVRYLFNIEGNEEVVPYALAGLAIGRASHDDEVGDFDVGGSNTEVGLRLGGGIKAPMDQFVPFAELGLGVGDIPDFTIRAGLSFLVGG